MFEFVGVKTFYIELTQLQCNRKNKQRTANRVDRPASN